MSLKDIYIQYLGSDDRFGGAVPRYFLKQSRTRTNEVTEEFTCARYRRKQTITVASTVPYVRTGTGTQYRYVRYRYNQLQYLYHGILQYR